MKEFENKSLNVKGVIYGSGPVQAEGTVNDFKFYFRAKYDEWTFSISEYSYFDPVDIQLPEFGVRYGYFTEARFKGASYMEVQVALDLIETCVADYLNQRKSSK
jgi:hypothetical protein